jgi:hypothetical protein
MSIIIIGVGDDDFTKMKELDADKVAIKNSAGVATKRDIVQFVRMNDFDKDMTKLSEEVLKEVPDQLVKYIKMQGIKPVKLQFAQVPN